jgi:purine-binding chemotaxis protein CheW
MSTTASIAVPVQHLTFVVGEEEYALEVRHVREVVETIPITRVPSMPPAIRGVVNLRGSVVPVIDLGVRFGLPERTITKRTCVVVVEVELQGEPTAMGLLVDAVNQVIELRPDEVEPVPTFGTRVRVDLLRGLGTLGSKFVLLLELDTVLSPDNLMAQAVLAPAAAEPPAPVIAAPASGIAS